jgi:hypothetical protein
MGSIRDFRWRDRLARPVATFGAVSLFAGLVATLLRIAWDPSAYSYVEFVPIGAVFAAFTWDRVWPHWSGSVRQTLGDGLVVALALMRVFVPPLPFVSGHTLFASYAALTARRWPLRVVALGVLAQVFSTRFMVWGSWKTELGGVAVGLAAAFLAQRHFR